MDVGTLIALGSLALAVVGAFLGNNRYIYSMVQKMQDVLSARMTEHARELHTRVNDTRENWLRKDDFSGHMGRLEEGQRRMREDFREELGHVNERLDKMLAMLSHHKE